MAPRVPDEARVPYEAIRRSDELTKGAWRLYVQYCAHRNRDTGRCDPSPELLAEELTRTKKHIADMKTELARKGWIRRTGKNRVDLLVGDFGAVKVRCLEKKSDPRVGKFPDVGSENFRTTGPADEKNPTLGSEGIRTQGRKVSDLGEVSPCSEQRRTGKTEAAAAAATAAGFSLPEQDSPEGRRSVNQTYVDEVKARGQYPPEFVEYVWRKLLKHCEAAAAGSGFRPAPTVYQFEWWLWKERTPPAQQSLPGIPATAPDVRLHSASAASPPKRCDATCPLCQGTDWAQMPTGGVRRGCPNAAATGTEG